MLSYPRSSIAYSIEEAELVIANHTMDLYHKDIMKWLVKQAKREKYQMSDCPDPGVNDAECINFAQRLDQTYTANGHGAFMVHVDPLGTARWNQAYFAKRQRGMNHESATREVLAEIDAIEHGFPPPVLGPRPPLQPFPEPIDYRTELPWTPPRTRDFLRCDAWGIEMPGAPWVPGVLSQPERIFSWFLDRYSESFQHSYIDKMLSYDYTHLALSIPDSIGPTNNPGKTPGAGFTLEQFLRWAQKLKQEWGVKYLNIALGSKDFQQPYMTSSEYLDWAMPLLEACLDAGLNDEFKPGWEWNLWNTPGATTINIWKELGYTAKLEGASMWGHFSPHYTSWFADGDGRGRFGFWSDLGLDVAGIDYQTAGSVWKPNELQGRIEDTLWHFGTEGNIHKIRLYEDLAFEMSDHPSPTPEDANVRGYLGCCTIDTVRHTDAKVWGFGNGGRMPDGSPI